METAQKKADRALDDTKDAQRIIDAHKPDDGAKKGSDKSHEETASEDPAVT